MLVWARRLWRLVDLGDPYGPAAGTSQRRGSATCPRGSRTTQSSTRALRTLQSSFSKAHDRTDGPLWGIGTALPMIGDDVRAVRTVSAVGDDLSAGTLAELVTESGSGLRDRLVPQHGRIDIAGLESIAPMVTRGHRNLNEAAGRLRGADSTSLTRWVRPAYSAFASSRVRRRPGHVGRGSSGARPSDHARARMVRAPIWCSSTTTPRSGRQVVFRVPSR